MAVTTIDWIIVAGYFMVIFGIAWWVIKKRKNTTTDYFLAGRELGWFIIGASIFASNIGSEHLVGLAGSGATDGVVVPDSWSLPVRSTLPDAWSPHAGPMPAANLPQSG